MTKGLEIARLKEEARYWKEQYDFKYASWLSLRELYNRTIREHDAERRPKNR